MKDRQTGAITRVSLTGGVQGIAESTAPRISGGGRFVVFTTAAALVPEDTNACASGDRSVDVFQTYPRSATNARV